MIGSNEITNIQINWREENEEYLGNKFPSCFLAERISYSSTVKLFGIRSLPRRTRVRHSYFSLVVDKGPGRGLRSCSMDPARNAQESLDLVFHMSNILDTGLDRHTLSVLVALCDLGLNPEALAAIVKEFRTNTTTTSTPATPSVP